MLAVSYARLHVQSSQRARLHAKSIGRTEATQLHRIVPHCSPESQVRQYSRGHRLQHGQQWLCSVPSTAQSTQTARHLHMQSGTLDASICINGSGGNNNNNVRRKLTDNPDHSNNSGRQLAFGWSTVLPILLLQLVHAGPAAAWGRSKAVTKQEEQLLLPGWEIDAFVDKMWDLSGPILNNMGFSGLLGAASAAALKFVGRTLAASVGLALVLVQVLSYHNVVTVNWSVVHQQLQEVLDSTGDGRLDQDDFKRYLKKGMIILSEGVPSISGFMVGFIVGLKVF